MSKVITPVAQISYPHVFTTDKNDKYGATLVFAPGTDLKEMKLAAIEVAVEKFGEAKAKEMLKKGQIKLEGGSHHTFRTDAEAKGYAEGSVFVNARGNRQPGVVSIYPDPKTGKPLPITNPELVYPGALVKASLTPFWYEKDGNKGIAWGLNNLQVIDSTAPRIDGRARAEDEFEADAEATADLSTLTEGEGEAELAGVGAGSRKDELAKLLG